MINLRNSPFLWFSFLLLVGFGLANATGLQPDFRQTCWLWIACLFSVCWAILRYQPGRALISTVAITFLILAAGMLRVTYYTSQVFSGELITSSILMEGKVFVRQVLKVRENGISLRCQVEYLNAMDDSIPLSFTDKFILLQIREMQNASLFPGDVIQIQGRVQALQAPLNPHAFDIRRYYATLGIRHHLFCKANEIQIESPASHSIARITAKWQSNLSRIVRQNTSDEVAQLTNALVWGDRSDMADEVRDAFADSGAMHVLSVSGMHVAIIYSMLYLILGAPGSGSFVRRMIRLLCYLVSIILYIGLTGACPAVVRAGLMIILYLLGKAMGWNTQIWNLLGFAAFIMLWINPFIWMNIGFQLSFLAMAGILMYAQPLIRSLGFKQKILHLTWEITAVSIAAQVFILPVLLKQFHQFPLTFILSSLVAMPASYIIIFGALLNVFFSLMGWDGLWPLLDGAGTYFILSMKWMAGLNPQMNFSLTATGSILMLMIAVFFTVALVYKWPFGKKLAYWSAILTFTSLGIHRMVQWQKDEIVIYHHSKGLLVDVILNGSCYTILDSTITPQQIEFTCRGYRCYRDVIHNTVLGKDEEYSISQLNYTASVIRVASASVMIWNNQAVTSLDSSLITHVIVDTCDDAESLLEFLGPFRFPVIIIPAHLKWKTKNPLVRLLKAHDIPYYDISSQGYYRLRL